MKELARHVATRAVRQTSTDMTMQTMYDYYSHGYADYTGSA